MNHIIKIVRDFTMRLVFDRKNETSFKNKAKGKTYKETGLLQIEVKQDGTDKRAYVSTGIKATPDQISISVEYKTVFFSYEYIYYLVLFNAIQ